MSDVRLCFDEASAMPDAVARAEAFLLLAFHGRELTLAGDRGAALEVFELLATLDRYDDLLHPAIECADEYLVLPGARTQPSLDSIVEELHGEFQHLSEQRRLLAVAKKLVRKHHRRRPEVWGIANDLINAAEKLHPLGRKDFRFRADILQRID